MEQRVAPIRRARSLLTRLQRVQGRVALGIPAQDLNEKNPQNTAAAHLSESLDLSAPDRADDQAYNRILWLMLKSDIQPPMAQSHAALHALQSSK